MYCNSEALVLNVAKSHLSKYHLNTLISPKKGNFYREMENLRISRVEGALEIYRDDIHINIALLM